MRSHDSSSGIGASLTVLEPPLLPVPDRWAEARGPDFFKHLHPCIDAGLWYLRKLQTRKSWLKLLHRLPPISLGEKSSA
jgi:hypothetical protein